MVKFSNLQKITGTALQTATAEEVRVFGCLFFKSANLPFQGSNGKKKWNKSIRQEIILTTSYVYMQPLHSLVQKPKKHLTNRILVCKTITNLNPFTLPGLKKTNTSKDDWQTRPTIWSSKTSQNDQMKHEINTLRTDSSLCSLLKKAMVTNCLIWNLKTPGYKKFKSFFFNDTENIF